MSRIIIGFKDVMNNSSTVTFWIYTPSHFGVLSRRLVSESLCSLPFSWFVTDQGVYHSLLLYE